METACWFIKSYFYTDHLPPEYIHKSCLYAYIPPLIVDVKFVVLGFTYKYWGYVLIKFGIVLAAGLNFVCKRLTFNLIN